MSMRTVLKSGWFWFFLWLCFLGLICLTPVPSKAKSLKTFYHSGNMNRAYRDFKWEAEHFDAFLGNWNPVYYDTLKIYNPNMRIYNYLLVISCPKSEEMYDSLKAFFGSPPDSALIHFKYDLLVFPYFGGQENIIRYQHGWNDSNDVVGGSNGIRDYTAINGLSSKRGEKYIVDTTKNWTVNQWTNYGVWDYNGSFVDTIASNTFDSLTLKTPWDSTTLVPNYGFESGWGNWSGYTNGDGNGAIDTMYHVDGTHSVKITRGSTGFYYIRQKINMIDKTAHAFRMAVRCPPGTDNVRLLITKGSDVGQVLADTYLVGSLCDNSWHYIRSRSFGIGSEDSAWVNMGWQTPSTGDTVWVDSVMVWDLTGRLTSASAAGSATIFYPYIIDNFSAPVHNATAMAKDSTAEVPIFNWDKRVLYPGRNGMKEFISRWAKYKISKCPSCIGLYADEIGNIVQGELWRGYGIEYQTSSDTLWKKHVAALLAAVKDTLNNRSKQLLANILPVNDSQYYYSTKGGIVEGYAKYQWLRANKWADIYSTGHNQFDAGLKGFKIVKNMPRLNFVMAHFNDNSFTSDIDVQVSALAYYYLVRSDSSYYMYNGAYDSDTAKSRWQNIWGIDIGNPLDTAYQFASGIDANSDSFVVVGRKYSGSTETNNDTVLVLFKPLNKTVGWSDETATSHSLGGSYLWLKADGSARGVYSTVSLRFGEGAILLRLGCD